MKGCDGPQGGTEIFGVAMSQRTRYAKTRGCGGVERRERSRGIRLEYESESQMLREGAEREGSEERKVPHHFTVALPGAEQGEKGRVGQKKRLK